MSPFNAWIFTRGLETLSLRMKAHSHAAQEVAEWLSQRAKISRVYYPGLKSHPQHELACTQQSGFGGIVAFDVEGGQDAAWQIVDQLKIFSITANLGDVKSTVTHPATTTHHRISADQREAAGINNGMLRLAVGLEDTQDLIADLDQALSRAS